MPLRISTVLTFAILGLAPAGPAAAQLRPKLPNPLGKKAEASAAARTTPAPTFNDRVLEITPRRADQLLKGYRAEAAALDRADREYAEERRKFEAVEKGHPARRAAWEKRHREWEGCQDREVKPAEAEQQRRMDAANAQVGANDPNFQKKMDDLKARMQAAQAKGDMNEVMRLADSVQKAMAPAGRTATDASQKMQAAATKCGPEPEEPEAPSPPLKRSADPESAGSAGAGLTLEQYAIMKERVEAVLGDDGKLRSEEGLSQAEAGALRQRGGELAGAIRAVRDHGA